MQEMQDTHEIWYTAQQERVRAVVSHYAGTHAGVVLLGGTLGGAQGPEGVYEELAIYLRAAGISVLRTEFRRPGSFVACVFDMLGAVGALQAWGAQRIALVAVCASEHEATFAPAARGAIAGLCGVITGVANIVCADGGTTPSGHRLPAGMRLIGRNLPATPASGRAALLVSQPTPEHLTISLSTDHLRAADHTSVIEKLYSWSTRLLLTGGHAAHRQERPDARVVGLAIGASQAQVALPRSALGLSAQWEAVLLDLALRDPASAAAARLAAVHAATDGATWLNTWPAWSLLDTPARLAWMHACAQTWKDAVARGKRPQTSA